jgi:dihydroneopterin aldolase
MSDQIRISGIKAFGYHGVFEHEAINGQDFFVDVLLNVDLHEASVSDDLTHTVDYGSITDLVVLEVTGDRVQLIERLAGRIADAIKEQYVKVISVSVTVHKPQAPVNAHVADISVTITR